VERARRLIVLSFMGFGSNAHARVPTGFRSNSSRSGTTPSHDWMNYPAALSVAVERLRGVTIENRCALKISPVHDSPDTLFYFDPPYVQSTRGVGSGDGKRRYDVLYRGYTHELDDAGHQKLLAFLPTLKGMVVLSGYPTDFYNAALGDWQRIERKAFADGARERVEVLWLNPACAARLRDKGSLFEATA
jgi:DNA adenine methylase